MMVTSRQMKFWVLKALRAAESEMMPDQTLRSHVRMAFPRGTITETELSAVLEETEHEGWAASSNDPILGRLWILTPKGEIKAAQLP